KYTNTGQPSVKFVSDGTKIYGLTQTYAAAGNYKFDFLVQFSKISNSNSFSVVQKPLSSLTMSSTALSDIPGLMAYEGKVNVVTEYPYMYTPATLIGIIDTNNNYAHSNNAVYNMSVAEENRLSDYDLKTVVSGKFNGDTHFDFVGMKAPSDTTKPPVFLAFYKDTNSDYLFKFNTPVTLALHNATGISYDKIKDVVSGDFNNDGKTDILTIYRPQSGQCEIYVWENQGNDTLKAVKWKASHSFATTAITGRVVAGDFNGDGGLDLAAVAEAGDNITIQVWTKTGTATFSDPSAWFTSTGGYSVSKIKGVVSGKFYNSDNKSEIVVLYQYTSPTTEIKAHVFAPSQQ
ncbi:MAG TPA: VCBS repeat-containing protein, partial [bacterium]|nr:VCBS repeat-containing protein [bacterium]